MKMEVLRKFFFSLSFFLARKKLYLIPLNCFRNLKTKLFLCLESLGVCSEKDESEDNMSVEEAKSEVASSEDFEDDERYETITISEAPPDEERYDRDIDTLEEERAMENFKGYYSCILL